MVPKIHPRRKLRMQSSIQPGSNHRPGCRCGSRRNLWKQIRISRGRKFRGDSRQTESAPLNKQEPGRLGEGLSDEAQNKLMEQSRDLKRATGWHGTPRRLGTEVSRDRRMSIWGDSEADRRRYRGREAKGQPGAFTTGTAEGERIEATRRSITGEAGGTERGAT